VTSTGLSRREFLIALNAAALVTVLDGCIPGGIGQSPPAGSSAYERALLLLRDAVRASPDHLTLRAAEVVGGKDAGKIVEFVRDHIAAVPPFSFLDDARLASRWGPAATLRGGQGTLRERADLLASLLTRAGFPAQVMGAERPTSIGLSDLYRSRAIPFEPDSSRIDAARAQLRQDGLPPAPTPQAFDPGPDPVAAILAALPAPLQSTRPRADLVPAQVPVVEFDAGGSKHYAFALGDLGVTGTAPTGLTKVFEAEPVPLVSITVSAVSNPGLGSITPRGKLVDLVTGHWPADVVVGHQVLLTFMPPQGPNAYLHSPLSSLPMRVPVLRVQTDSSPGAAAQSLTVTGSPVTINGDVFPPASSSPSDVAGPYGTIKVLSETDRKAAIAAAAAVHAQVNPSAFPEVELEVAVVDGAGHPVDGLDARSFSVTEQGKAVDGFTLYSNVKLQDRPRVLIAYDTSGSALSTWPSPAEKAAFEHALGVAVAAGASPAAFDVQVVALGSTPDPKAWTDAQADAIAAAMSAARSGDETWGTIAGPGLDQGVVAVVLAADSNDEDTEAADIPALKSRLALSRVPVFVLPFGKPGETDEIASISGGAQLDRKDPGKLTALLQPLVKQWLGGAYRLRYVAPADGPSDRNVSINLIGRTGVPAVATYSVPSKPLAPPSFVSLQVTIQVAGLSSTRRLAGLQVKSNGFPFGSIDDVAAIAETRAAMDGITTIAIEPGTPTTAALLDDVLTSFLSIAPLRPLWARATRDQLLQAVSKGVHRTPGLLALILQPQATDPGAVPALKVAILQERAPSSNVIERHVDLAFGVNSVLAVTPDPRAAFRSVVATSVAASAAEAQVMDDSAYRRLSGRQLIAIPLGDFGGYHAYIDSLPAEKRLTWQTVLATYGDVHFVAPVGGVGDAFWVIDPPTGITKAVLLDGTGGGLIRAGCHFSATDELAMTLSMLSILCGASPDVFPVVCLGITTASVAMTVAGLFDPNSDPGTPFGAAAGVFNPLGKQFAGLNAAIGVALILVTIQSSCS
jgi:hypothetical protein